MIRSRPLAHHFASTADPAVAALLGHPTDGIMVLDRDGLVVRANARLRALAGSEARLHRGAPGQTLLALLDQSAIWPHVAAMLAGRTDALPTAPAQVAPAPGDNTARAPQIAVSGTPLREPDGTVGGVILWLTDIAPQRWLEAELAQGRRLQALGQLAGGVAHDFNNLLTVVLGAADAIRERTQTDTQTGADAALITESAQRGAALVQQLLAFGRQQQLAPRALAVNAIVRDLAELLRRLLGSAIRLDVELEEPGRVVRADPARLDQVLMNLATNARDAMPQGGTLTLRTGHITLFRPLATGAEAIPPGRYVMIEVCDTGIGIPPDILPRIFEPFFTTRRDRGGTGLGLSTVHGIVRQSDGFIGVDSAPGAGTRIRIYLPRWDAEAPAAAPAPVAAPAPAQAPRHRAILLVEDEDAVRHLAQRALTRAGWTVLTADCAEVALRLLDTDLPALAAVVTDMIMPGLDGAGLVRALRARPGLSALPAVLVSGYADASLRRQAAEAATVFLAKPYKLADLTAQVFAAVANGSQIDEHILNE